MDNIVHPEQAKWISSPCNLSEEKERLDRLVGIVQRIIPRMVNVSPETKKKHRSTTRPSTISKEIPGITPKTETDVMETESLPVPTNFPNTNDKQRETTTTVVLERCKTERNPTISGDNVKVEEQYRKSQENAVENFGGGAAKFLPDDTNHLIGGAVENTSLPFEADDDTEKSTSEQNLLQLIDEISEFSFAFNTQNATSNTTEFQSDLNSFTGEVQIERSHVQEVPGILDFTNLISEECMPTGFDFFNVLNEPPQKSPSSEGISYENFNCESANTTSETMDTNLTDGTSETLPCIETTKNDLNTATAAENVKVLPKSNYNMETKKPKLTIAGNYHAEYADKMATFLDIKNFPRAQFADEPKELETLVCDSKNTNDVKCGTSASQNDNDTRPRLRSARKNNVYVTNQSNPPLEQRHYLQSLMTAQFVSLTNYETDIQLLEDQMACPKNEVVDEDNCFCNSIKKEKEVNDSGKCRSTISGMENSNEDMKPGISKEKYVKENASNPTKENIPLNKNDAQRPYDKDKFTAFLEEKFKACNPPEKSSEFISDYSDPPSNNAKKCLLPNISKLLEEVNSKRSGKGKAALIYERLNNVIRREGDKVADGSRNVEVDIENDFIITVSLFHSIEKEYLSSIEKRPVGVPKLIMKLDALGQNTLEDLCNAFLCYNDYIGLTELDHPRNYSSALHTNVAHEKFSSATLSIGDTIYSNGNKSSCVDTGGILTRWGHSSPAKGIGPFKEGYLNTTQLKDLTLQFGYPYVYIHLGSCEHTVVFNQARKIRQTDPMHVSLYPILQNYINFENIYCKTHYRNDLKFNTKTSKANYLARYAVVDDERLPENPMLLCRTCVDSFCYDKKGQKTGNFKLFPFIQVAGTLK